MKKRWIILLGLIAVVMASAAFLFFSRNAEQTALGETRRALRQQGFKIDLAEFNFSTSPELGARAAALTNAFLAGTAFRSAGAIRRAMLMQERLELMPPVGSNAALVVWKQDKLQAQSSPYLWRAQSEVEEHPWPALREAFNEGRAGLDTACEAALSGPIGFSLDASRGIAMLLPHLTVLRSLNQMLTNGDYDGTALFEVPVSYEAATNIGVLHLVVDGGLDAASRGEEGERQTCERAANGNCLLGWTSTYDPPGKHAIQAEFIATKDEDKEETALRVKGPAVPFVSTNLCQFDSAYDHFDARGVTLYARLPESNGVYNIELKAPAGAHLKTLKGTTSNGVIRVHWDLIDDHGHRCTNESMDSVFQVTLPGSGRSQTLKGP